MPRESEKTSEKSVINEISSSLWFFSRFCTPLMPLGMFVEHGSAAAGPSVSGSAAPSWLGEDNVNSAGGVDFQGIMVLSELFTIAHVYHEG